MLMNLISGLLLKHWPLGLELRGMGKGRLVNDVGVPIGVNESH